MSYRDNYPATVAEVLRPNRKYRPEVLRAVRAFARSKPWTGSIEERRQKFSTCLSGLASAYGIATPALRLVAIGSPESNGFYSRLDHAIGLMGKLSVLTFLHEFAHAIGKDERQACIWSINLFARVFPRSFARCHHHHHTLRSK